MKVNSTLRVKLYSSKGVVGKDVTLPKIYTGKIKKSLLDQAIRVYEDKMHTGLSKVKTRAEVVRTKKKWYKQKGTGGARHGAKSAPIFVGGGVAHGPKGVKRILNLPDKMRKKAYAMAVGFVFQNKKAVLIDNLEKVEKTKEAAKIVEDLRKKLEIKKSNKILLVLKKNSFSVKKYYKNITNLEIELFENLNAYKLLKYKFVFFDKNIFAKK